jgi:hypothetical protein
LFFTRLDGDLAIIYRAVRRSNAPFDMPEPVSAIRGFAEAPASPAMADRSTITRDGDRFAIYRVTR